ncbi:unnamed protein product, partial [Amoebophrya sp. A120]
LCRSFSEIRNYFDRERDLLAAAARANSGESELSREDILFNEIFTYFKERAVLVWLLRRIRDAEQGSARNSNAAAGNVNANLQSTSSSTRTLLENGHAMRLLGEKGAERLDKQRAPAARLAILDSEIKTGSTRSNHHNNAQVTCGAAEPEPAAGAGFAQVKKHQEPDSPRLLDDRSKIMIKKEQENPGNDPSASLSRQGGSSQHQPAANPGPDFEKSGKTSIKQEKRSSASPMVSETPILKAESLDSPDVQFKAEVPPPENVTIERSIKRDPELITTSSAGEREKCASTTRIKCAPTSPGAAGRRCSRVNCEPECTSKRDPVRIKKEPTSPTSPESPRFRVKQGLIFPNTCEEAGTLRAKKEQHSPSTKTQSERIGFLGRPLQQVKREAAPVSVNRSANNATCETQQNAGGHLVGDEKS